MKMKAYEVVGEALASEGVDTIFGLMTSDNMGLLTHLVGRGFKVVRARTEHGAICMADGYARASGKLAVVTVGAGPSAGMTATALVTAQRRKTPLVLICGDVPITDRHHLKRFDQDAFFKNATGYCLSVASTRTIVEDTYQVLRHARSGAGPAVLNFPVDLLETDVDMEDIGADWRYMSPWRPPPVPIADPEAIDEVAALLAGAERPLLIAGRGAVAANAREAIMNCGKRVGALLGTSLQGQHYFDDDFYVGVVGGLGFGQAMQLVDQADVVIAIGAGLNVYTSHFGTLFPQAKTVQIDSRADAFGNMTPVDVPILGDARATIEAINAALERMGVSGRTGFRTEETRAEIAAARASVDANYTSSAGVMDPRELLDVLQKKLTKDRMDVVDAGHFMYFVVDRIKAAEPEQRIWTADFASIGVAVSIGIGVALGRPDLHAVVYVGDGGFMMSLLELDTAVRHRIPITMIVINDEAFGAEVRYLENRGVSYELACFKSPNLEMVVKGLGCEAVTVRSIPELEAACERIGKTEGPYVIDARIDLGVVHKHLGTRQSSAAASS